MLKVTAILPTKNEALHIADTIKSVSWADEILVIDSFSTDATVEIATQAGATILQHAFDNHARQKNRAIDKAAHDWVFILDADERVTPGLLAEIQETLTGTPKFAAYWIKRSNFFMGQPVHYSGWQNDKVIRLFRKSLCRYPDKNVHEEIECQAPVGILKNKLLHYTYRDLPHYLEKWDSYTWKSAADYETKTGVVTLYHLWLKPAFSFFKHYILKLGFLDGKVGFIISYMAATSVFMRYLKLFRMREDNKPNLEA